MKIDTAHSQLAQIDLVKLTDTLNKMGEFQQRIQQLRLLIKSIDSLDFEARQEEVSIQLTRQLSSLHQDIGVQIVGYLVENQNEELESYVQIIQECLYFNSMLIERAAYRMCELDVQKRKEVVMAILMVVKDRFETTSSSITRGMCPHHLE